MDNIVKVSDSFGSASLTMKGRGGNNGARCMTNYIINMKFSVVKQVVVFPE